MKTPIPDLEEVAALNHVFRIIQEGLTGLVEADHFFNLLADDIVTEFIVTVPGYPSRVEGRAALAELYRPYGTALRLDACSDLRVHHDPATGVVVLEYASEGRAVGSGAPYRNRFISVLTVRHGGVVHRRDHLNPLAVFDALGWPER